MRPMGWAACALLAVCLAGCSAASKQKTSDGKTYTPAAKGKQSAAGGSSPARTSVTPRPDDTGSQNPQKGQVVLNPAAPVPAQPAGSKSH